MAQWVNRPRSDGGLSIQIKWRMDGAWQSETFTDARLAAEFRTAVETADHRWPDGWVKGQGWNAVPPPTAVITFADVAAGAEGYFEAQARRVKRGKLKPYTLHRYRRDYELNLAELFSHLPFREIEAEDVADWVDQQIEAGTSSKTIRNRHGLLSSIMKHGRLRMRLRPDNPCELTELPESVSATSEARQIRFFQPEEWTILRSCFDQDFRLPMDLDLATGIRWGELSALRVGDVSFSGKKKNRQANIHIVRSWSKRAPDDPAEIKDREGETATWVLGPPKSKRPRWVVVTGDVAIRLEAALAGRSADDYVFLTPQGHPWRYPDFHAKRWTPAKKKAVEAGLTKMVTPHMLRHTTVVWSLAAGVPIQVISEMIGHTSLQMTYDIYGGLINLRDPAMAQAMAKAMMATRA